LLYEIFSGKKNIVAQLSFNNGVGGVADGAKKALAQLPANDPVSPIIRGLLHTSPSRRMTVADAVARLHALETTSSQ
jgi:hypothetical protein